MGIDAMIQNNNPNWNNNVVFIRINKEIVVPMKQINKQLQKEFEEKKKKVLSVKEIKKGKEKQKLIDKKDKYYLSRLESNDY
jgi:hypothetical protein